MTFALFAAAFTAATPASAATVSVETTDPKKAPPELAVEGERVAAARFRDRGGLHWVVVTTLTPAQNAEEAGRSKMLYGYHFTQTGDGSWKRLWRTQDFVRACEFDLNLAYVEDSLSITDLDGDGTAETRFIYRLSCRSDVSPETVKLLMHEGKKKYAIRGEEALRMGPGEVVPAERKPDPAPAQWPKPFLRAALEAWTAAARTDFTGGSP